MLVKMAQFRSSSDASDANLMPRNRQFEFSASSERTISDTGAYIHIETIGLSYENSTSAVLNYCKAKVLQPYFKLLSTLGWRPLWCPTNMTDHQLIVRFINALYTALIILLIISGYLLQYCCCYNGDGLKHITQAKWTTFSQNVGQVGAHFPHPNGTQNDEKTSHTLNEYNLTDKLPKDFLTDYPSCKHKLFSVYVLPYMMHFIAYIFVLRLMRMPECERLENLMERGFLQTSRTSNWLQEHRRLIRTLRSFLLICLVWVLMSFTFHMIHFNFAHVSFTCMPVAMDKLTSTLLIYLTIGSLICHDIICAAVVTSYAVHCQLNISFVRNICQSIRERRIDFQEFFKRVEESRKFIDYLNHDQACGVSLLLVVFMCRIVMYVNQLLTVQRLWFEAFFVTLNLSLWIMIALLPLIQAMRLTSCIKELKIIGHELMSRPFGYRDVDQLNLDSLVLYTSNLHMEGRILFVPIRSSHFVFVCFVLIMVIPLLGQINVINI